MRKILEYDLSPADSGPRSVRMSIATTGLPIAFVNLGGRPTICIEGDDRYHEAPFTFWLVGVGEEPPFEAACRGSAIFESVAGRPCVVHCYMMLEED